MSLDWITVGAQIINFLVLVWLLRRFLYAPIMQAMDKREARIKARFSQAEAREKQAAEQAHALETSQRKLDADRATLMDEARSAADEQEQELVARAKAQVDEQSRVWKRLVLREKEDFLAHLQKTMTVQVSELARAALEDLADSDLEPRIVRVFCHMLEHLPDSEREDFMAGYSKSGATIDVQTPIDLADRLRKDVRDALHAIVSTDAAVNFSTDKSMSAGIIARAGSRSVSWTIDSYMKDLRARAESELATLEQPLDPAPDEAPRQTESGS